MTLLRRLRARERRGEIGLVAVSGAGRIGRGILVQLARTPGLRPALCINRTTESAVRAWEYAGADPGEVVVSDDPDEIRRAVSWGRPVVARDPAVLETLHDLDAVVEATGAVEHGARVALHAIAGGQHVIMMNAEADATVGCALHARARAAGVVYTNADGDQPAVLMRLIEFVESVGLTPRAAVNCKGFLDRHATPDSIAEWAEAQDTSPAMTAAMTDGTKMNLENAVIANATGLLPDVRGMHGVRTTMDRAVADCLAVFGRGGVVDYTLGGDFGGGVFVLAEGDGSVDVQRDLQYLKMGEGPSYLFYRPWHLCHFETPASVAEAILDGEPTIAPLGAPVADVIAVAKRDLRAGERLDGVGGYTCYGQIDTVERAAGLLPIGLAANVRITRDVRRDEPIPLAAVEIDDGSVLLRLREEQIREHAPDASIPPAPTRAVA